MHIPKDTLAKLKSSNDYSNEQKLRNLEIDKERDNLKLALYAANENEKIHINNKLNELHAERMLALEKTNKK